MVNQPQTVQPAGHHVRVHPAPMVAVVAPVAIILVPVVVILVPVVVILVYAVILVLG